MFPSFHPSPNFPLIMLLSLIFLFLLLSYLLFYLFFIFCLVIGSVTILLKSQQTSRIDGLENWIFLHSSVTRNGMDNHTPPHPTPIFPNPIPIEFFPCQIFQLLCKISGLLRFCLKFFCHIWRLDNIAQIVTVIYRVHFIYTECYTFNYKDHLDPG